MTKLKLNVETGHIETERKLVPMPVNEKAKAEYGKKFKDEKPAPKKSEPKDSDQTFLESVYGDSEFFCSYSFVYQVFYSNVQKRYYAVKIAHKVGKATLAKKGSFLKVTAENVRKWFEDGTIL